MADQFCVKCGRQLPTDAQFCSGCGSPVTANGTPPPLNRSVPGMGPQPATMAVPGDPLPDPLSQGNAAPVFPPAPVPRLGVALGLEGVRTFLLQHELLAVGRNYRVLNHEKKHLFTVHEDRRQEFVSNILERQVSRPTGLSVGGVGLAPLQLLWRVLDPSGAQQGSISIQVSGNTAVSTLTDGAGSPILSVRVDRSMAGGLTATASFPDGRVMFTTRGNALRHNFSIHDPSGTEVAKIHEAWASARDTYNLDIVGDVDPLFPLIFAILIDREKGT